ncbi:hypothetical protein HYH03_006940 [Edaphochlamys debaryana]|uniref:Solute carrier family 40 protein n=1 Tax=Edaphochlamys debaryana TaxID=47281 RepID=A0A835Y4G4_9CHLO|nr:hypothetical protein HYH03_006940 [Edaphochlamys debaryana]|eukprot:KAG2495007.1 hypothetical protein HYH03_006940 [Edaphochlamys debaryana]
MAPNGAPEAGPDFGIHEPGAHRRAKTFLCLSYSLAAIAARSWEFMVALLLIELYPDSLLMVVAYGLLENLSSLLLSPVVGTYLDRRERLPGARAMLFLQNQAICASALAALLLLWRGKDGWEPEWIWWALLWTLTVLGALSTVGNSGVQIAMERESVAALCAGAGPTALSDLNSLMRAIDLGVVLAAPFGAGVLMTFAGPLPAAAVMAAYCASAFVPEVLLLQWAFHASPALRAPKAAAATAASDAQSTAVTADPEGSPDGDDVSAVQGEGEASLGQPLLPGSSSAPRKQGTLGRIVRHIKIYGGAWRTYAVQPIALPCVALAVLYMSVLSLHALMTSYLKWSGLTEAEVSVYRGAGALTGLAATVLFPLLQRTVGLRAAAVVGITEQLACLAAGVLPVALAALAAAQASGGGWRPAPASVRLLVAGVVGSRTGLWLFDLALMQLIQEEVPQSQLGTVYGVQNSLQAGFELLSFVAALACPDPTRFHWLMLLSLGSVGLSCALTWAHVASRGMEFFSAPRAPLPTTKLTLKVQLLTPGVARLIGRQLPCLEELVLPCGDPDPPAAAASAAAAPPPPPPPLLPALRRLELVQATVYVETNSGAWVQLPVCPVAELPVGLLAALSARSAAAVTELSLHAKAFGAVVMVPQLSAVTQLRALELHASHADERWCWMTLAALASMLAPLSGLRSLTLGGEFSSSPIHSLKNYTKLSGLEELHLSNAVLQPDSSLAELRALTRLTVGRLVLPEAEEEPQAAPEGLRVLPLEHGRQQTLEDLLGLRLPADAELQFGDLHYHMFMADDGYDGRMGAEVEEVLCRIGAVLRLTLSYCSLPASVPAEAEQRFQQPGRSLVLMGPA